MNKKQALPFAHDHFSSLDENYSCGRIHELLFGSFSNGVSGITCLSSLLIRSIKTFVSIFTRDRGYIEPTMVSPPYRDTITF